eukprot:384521_1
MQKIHSIKPKQNDAKQKDEKEQDKNEQDEKHQDEKEQYETTPILPIKTGEQSKKARQLEKNWYLNYPIQIRLKETLTDEVDLVEPVWWTFDLYSIPIYLDEQKKTKKKKHD